MPRAQIQAGKLDQRIEIHAPSQVQDATGYVDASETELVAIVWASVEAMMGRESFAGQQVTAETTYKIRVRHPQGEWEPRADQTIVWKNRRFQIQNIQNPDGGIHEVVLICIERNDGS